MTTTCPRCGTTLFEEDTFCPTCATVESHRTRFSRAERAPGFYDVMEGIIIGFGIACIVGLLWCWW